MRGGRSAGDDVWCGGRVKALASRTTTMLREACGEIASRKRLQILKVSGNILTQNGAAAHARKIKEENTRINNKLTRPRSRCRKTRSRHPSLSRSARRSARECDRGQPAVRARPLPTTAACRGHI